MKLVFKTHVIFCQGDTSALTFDATQNTLFVTTQEGGTVSVKMHELVATTPDVAIDTSVRYTEITPQCSMPSLDETDVDAAQVETQVETQAETQVETQADAGLVPPISTPKRSRRLSDSHRLAIAERLAKQHDVKEMLDGQGKTVQVSKVDFADALRIGYIPKCKNLVLHDPKIWADHIAGQSKKQGICNFILKDQKKQSLSQLLEKIADMLDAGCVLGAPKVSAKKG